MPNMQQPGKDRPPNRMMLRRALFLLIVCGIVAFIVLLCQMFRIQILDHERYESAALEQQLRSTAVPAVRGRILDRNGNVLAMSATASTIYLSPAEMRMNGEDPAFIADGLSAILGVDREKILELCSDRKSWYKTVARKVEDETADAVRRFKTENQLKSVKIESDTRRYYPYSSLAAHIIGFTGMDNTGLSGVEYTFDEILTGRSGSVERLKNSAGTDMLFAAYEEYLDAEDGSDIKLTLDVAVQYYLEKHLKQAIVDYDVKNGAAAIAVDPRSGGILGMVSLGSFDLNNYQLVSDEIRAEIDAAPEEERAALLSAAQQRQWRNKAISDTYEPGSTFKIITLAMALEEGLVNEQSSFYCGGSMSVPGRGKPLHCWRHAGHGSQTLTQAAQHSCNVAFANIGLRIGTETFYKYAEAFGFFKGNPDSAASLSGKTGISLPGESGSIWWSRDVFCSSENLSQLAAASFGQTFNITPLQLIMAVSACCNGGYLMEPRIVESVTAPDGSVETYEPTVLRQVISESTSRKLNAILEQVVCDKNEGTGRNAWVAGYRIAGKTGTSEKVAQDVAGGEKEYIVSFIGYAPAESPEIAVLVLLDTPGSESGIYISGGQMAAPVVGKIFADTLPTLGIAPKLDEEESALADRNVPNVQNLALGEAEQVLREAGFVCRTVGSGSRVTDQLPREGALVAQGSTVILYAGEAAAESSTAVPELTGLRYEEARDLLGSLGLFLCTENGLLSDGEDVYVAAQNYAAGSEAKRGTVIRVSLIHQNESNYGRY
ncbi:MAG: PASTA domain-containing protein [Ruminococcaceae bacterium]|nr:PASTA domain-containing protein [Oscillospiraceae bacterium]